jgi:hypothetical protein
MTAELIVAIGHRQFVSQCATAHREHFAVPELVSGLRFPFEDQVFFECESTFGFSRHSVLPSGVKYTADSCAPPHIPSATAPLKPQSWLIVQLSAME